MKKMALLTMVGASVLFISAFWIPEIAKTGDWTSSRFVMAVSTVITCIPVGLSAGFVRKRIK